MTDMEWATIAVALFIHMLAWAAMWAVLYNHFTTKNPNAKKWHRHFSSLVMGLLWLPVVIYAILVRFFIWSLNL